jgi:hypothetical protein
MSFCLPTFNTFVCGEEGMKMKKKTVQEGIIVKLRSTRCRGMTLAFEKKKERGRRNTRTALGPFTMSRFVYISVKNLLFPPYSYTMAFLYILPLAFTANCVSQSFALQNKEHTKYHGAL